MMASRVMSQESAATRRSLTLRVAAATKESCSLPAWEA